MLVFILAIETSVGVCLVVLGLGWWFVFFFFLPNRQVSQQNVGLEGNSVLFCLLCLSEGVIGLKYQQVHALSVLYF